MKCEKKDLVAKDEMQEPEKKPYTAPQMTIYGTMEKITGLIGGQPGDTPVGSGIG